MYRVISYCQGIYDHDIDNEQDVRLIDNQEESRKKINLTANKKNQDSLEEQTNSISRRQNLEGEEVIDFQIVGTNKIQKSFGTLRKRPE